MSISGYLSEFSLPEIFRLLTQGKKTGVLTITPLDANASNTNYYLWLQQGRIVAAADRLDGKGLLTLIYQRGWLSERVVSKLAPMCAIDGPVGTCLKTQGALQADQLKFLFQVQVLKQVCTLFTLVDGKFSFEATAHLPSGEMTGLNIPASEATLPGLRALKDWHALSDKLPDVNSALISIVKGQPQVRLDAKEWQVWEFANGTVAIDAIAAQLQLPVATVQQVGFRLMVAGLVEEVATVLPSVESSIEIMPEIEPLPQLPSVTIAMDQVRQPAIPSPSPEPTKAAVSSSLVKNLVSFLRSKI